MSRRRPQSAAFRDRENFKKIVRGILETDAEKEAKVAAISILLRPFSVSRNMQKKGFHIHHEQGVRKVRERIFNGADLDECINAICEVTTMIPAEHASHHMPAKAD
jgi:hypothetical protein